MATIASSHRFLPPPVLVRMIYVLSYLHCFIKHVSAFQVRNMVTTNRGASKFAGVVHTSVYKSFPLSVQTSRLRPSIPRRTISSSSILFSHAHTRQDSTTSNPIPITLLSGFLGAGKTSTLKHLLENSSLKIGVVVNDVAEVNIDAKLVASREGGIVELQNGCACCSLADELFLSIEKLIRKRELDAIVVELSGVADPMAIKSNWNVAPPQVRQLADIQRVVTLVDATTFGSDYMTWDTAKERNGWVDPNDDCAGMRKVAELLAEQVEAADLLILNKLDLATKEEADITLSVTKALNDKAEIRQVQFGRTSPDDLVHLFSTGVNEESTCTSSDCHDTSHSHSHDHARAGNNVSKKDQSTSHSHNHDHSCDDADCTDSSHSHSHSHSTSTDNLQITSCVYRASTPFDGRKLMSVLNQWPIPIKNVLDLGLLRAASEEGYEVGGRFVKESPFVGVLRSKGFCWLAPSKWSGSNEDAWRHETAMYWSHAGKHFSITAAGKWWDTIDKKRMKEYFVGNEEEYERILKEDFVSDEFGDRRQEIVFIGSNLRQDKIFEALDACLFTDEQMAIYRQKLRNYYATVVSTTPRGLFDAGGIDHADL